MEESTAKIIILAGFAVGVIFWLIALALYRKIANAAIRERIEVNLANKAPGEALNDLIAGGRLFSPQARLSRPAENRMTVSQSGIEVNLEAVRRGGGAQLIADVDDAAYTRRYAMGLGAFVLILMPAVVAGVPWALWHYVAPNDAPAIRWQAGQVAQIVHVLWPPFLIYNLWKQQRREVINSVSNALVLAGAAG